MSHNVSLWIIMIQYESLIIMIHDDSLWFIMIHYDSLRFIMVHYDSL